MPAETPVGWPEHPADPATPDASTAPVGWKGIVRSVSGVVRRTLSETPQSGEAGAATPVGTGPMGTPLRPSDSVVSRETSSPDSVTDETSDEVVGDEVVGGGPSLEEPAVRAVSHVSSEAAPSSEQDPAPGYDLLLGGPSVRTADVDGNQPRRGRHYREPCLPGADEVDASRVIAPAEAAIEPDTALLAAAGALPSRRSRRQGRPRVPSFDRASTYAPELAEPSEVAGELVDNHDEDRAPEHSTDAAGRPNRPTMTRMEQFDRPARTRIMTVANQKGGVGKTTTTVNVAAALAQGGLQVLVIDVDPQGNASTALSIDHDPDVTSVYDVIVDGEPLADVIHECPQVPGLWCAPATIDLAGAEIELVSLVARESRLHRAIETLLDSMPAEKRFDYVFIDCPPSLGLLTVNAFVAADEVFIPIQCEYYALEGLSQLLKNIEMIKEHLNPGLHVSTILMTMYDGRTKLATQVVEEVQTHFAEQTLTPLVPRSVRISEAPSHGETVMTYDSASNGAASYRQAAREIAARAMTSADLADQDRPNQR